MKYKFSLPLPYKSQRDNRRSNELMTVNTQRQLHYKSLNEFKMLYGNKLNNLIPLRHPKINKATRLTYVLHIKPTKGKPIKANPYRGSEPKNIDLVNLLSVVDKVFADELVKSNILVDDSIKYVQEVVFKVNPWADKEYVETTVEEIDPLPDPRLKKE